MKLFAALILSAAALMPSHAPGEAPADFERAQKMFIKELFLKGDYFQSIHETRRLLYYRERQGADSDYDFFILGNYYYGGQYKTIVHMLSKKTGSPDFRERLLLSHAYMKLGLFSAAFAGIKDLEYGGVAENFRLPLLLSRIDPLMHDFNYRKVIEEIQRAKPYIDEGKYGELYSSLDRYRGLPYRNIPAAVTLSLALPGAGQVYAGKYLHGIISLLGVAATATAAWYYAGKGNRGLEYSFVFFSSLFYLGGIYGAYNSAGSFNRDLDMNFVKNFRERNVPEYRPVTERDAAELLGR